MEDKIYKSKSKLYSAFEVNCIKKMLGRVCWGGGGEGNFRIERQIGEGDKQTLEVSAGVSQ